MKKLLLFTATVILSSFGYSQTFLGKDATLYKGATLKTIELKEGLQEYAYKNFYSYYDTTTKVLITPSNGDKKQRKNFKPFQIGEGYSALSEYSKMVGLEFTCTNVYQKDYKHYLLELKNDLIGTVYYEYNVQFKYNMELEVVGELNLPEDYFCAKVRIVKDKFEDKTRHYAPNVSGYSFTKLEEAGESSIYLSVEQHGSTLNIDGEGLIILFENGEKFSKPSEKIDVEVGKGGKYIYSVFIELNDSDIKLFSENLITDHRLYVYEGKVETNDAKKIQEYLKCVSK